jgi:rhamnogalacturonyl hydrolase YesR
MDVLAAADDLRRRTLVELTRPLERLIYLASTRDYNTGLYYHQGLAARFSEEAKRWRAATAKRSKSWWTRRWKNWYTSWRCICTARALRPAISSWLGKDWSRIAWRFRWELILYPANLFFPT